jgi:hypothetical protein
MKVNFVMLLIALAIAALAGYGFFAANSDEEFHLLLAAGSALTIFLTLGGLLALSVPDGGSANIKVTSAIFFVVFLVEQLIFGIFGVREAPYIIVTGILLLIFILVNYGIIRALK